MNPNIIFTKKDTAELIDRPMPEVIPGTVLVKLARSTISSGTERANLIGTPDGGVGIFSNPNSTKVSWPRQIGYSSSGTVIKVGDGVTGFHEGDRVALGGSVHAAYNLMRPDLLVKLPDNVSFAAAALTYISIFPLAAIRKCRVETGEAAIVMGQGVLGQLAVILLRASGATPVLAADPDAGKRAFALDIGADKAFDPTDPDFATQVKAYTDRNRKSIGPIEDAGPQIAIEVTGLGKALDNTLDAVAPMARVALLGCTRNSNFTIDYYHKVHGRGVTLIGAHNIARPTVDSRPGWWTQADDMKTFIKLISFGRISPEILIKETHKPSECGEVYSRLAAGGAFPVVQFDWE